MRFLLDQDVYAIAARFLRGHGHDVQTAQEAGLSPSPDRDILEAAHRDSRVLITRDRDFGALVFLGGASAGVIYLRMKPATANAVHLELQRILEAHGERDLVTSFVVVEAGGHRFRRPRRQEDT